MELRDTWTQELDGVAATLVETLDLATPPVALAFVDGPPARVRALAGAFPSACALWREAERGPFFASAAQHASCPVGAHVMGLPSDAQQAAALASELEAMVASGYVDKEELAHIPTVERRSGGIVYGPLAGFPLRPDVVVVWLQPRQAMLLQEASGQARWGQGRPSGLFGRPACAAVPIALGEGTVALSAGCTGMRTFTEVSGDLLLGVLPAEGLGKLMSRLRRVRAVNEVMRSHHEERLRAVDAPPRTP